MMVFELENRKRRMYTGECICERIQEPSDQEGGGWFA